MDFIVLFNPVEKSLVSCDESLDEVGFDDISAQYGDVQC
jgi:hypothetical protein